MRPSARYALPGYGYVRRFAAVIQVVMAAVTVVLLISGVPWWAAVVPVIAPVGATLVIVTVVRLCSVVMDWLDDHQRRKRRAERARHDQAAGREADSGP